MQDMPADAPIGPVQSKETTLLLPQALECTATNVSSEKPSDPKTQICCHGRETQNLDGEK